jgi:hypothetical protein
MPDLIGVAAGVVWNYLDVNGATSVAKMTKESTLDVKVLQRAIGWLANEKKIKIEMKGRTETISLK